MPDGHVGVVRAKRGLADLQRLLELFFRAGQIPKIVGCLAEAGAVASHLGVVRAKRRLVFGQFVLLPDLAGLRVPAMADQISALTTSGWVGPRVARRIANTCSF
jgi:hypothetical protein